MVASNRCMVGLVAATDAKPRQARPQLASPDEPETSGALNAGFVAANGARFSWTLDDNCFWQSALAELARVLTERLDVNFVYADYDIIDEHGRTVKHIRAQDPLGCSPRARPSSASCIAAR
jgi:hypothetical protein